MVVVCAVLLIFTGYPELRNLIGANVPDLRGRVLQERDAIHAVGVAIEAGLPNISGQFYTHIPFPSIYIHSQLFDSQTVRTGGINGYNCETLKLTFDASKVNSIYGKSVTVQPPAYAVRYLIRALP